MYDTSCEELARHFLGDDVYYAAKPTRGDFEASVSQLAQSIQDAIEGWFETQSMPSNDAWCCWCAVNGQEAILDASGRCPKHGIVRDRLLGVVQVDKRLLGDNT